MFKFCWHKWTNWKTVKEGNLLNGENIVGYYITQRRVCPKCGREELRNVEA
jgi:hypothetical protein